VKFDRASIMRESWRLRRKGMDASTALQFAWALARRDIRERASARPAPRT
jgi:predicted component of type VI protein secretion system